MTIGLTGRSLHVELAHATPEQQPILANLLQLYCYDFSESVDIEIGIDGKFPYDSLPLYWTEPHRHPFLVTVNGVPSGFALVKRAATSTDFETIWDMASFSSSVVTVDGALGQGSRRKSSGSFWAVGKFALCRPTIQDFASGSTPSRSSWGKQFLRFA